MIHTVLKSKIHGVRVTGKSLHYEGSCTIDIDLLEKANMKVHEQIHVVNVNNGNRFITYILAGERGSGIINLNGACARLGEIEDKVIIMTYAGIDDEELKTFAPTVLLMGEQNNIQEIR